MDKKIPGSTSSYHVDPRWYVDTGATDHLTNELDKQTMKEQYHGKEHVHTANGADMHITHDGQSILHSQSHPLHLKNVIYVPSVTRNLMCAKRFPCIIMWSLSFTRGISLSRRMWWRFL
jgi:hypothetical protein